MERLRGLVLVDIAVWSGRFFGVLVVGIAVAVGIKVALETRLKSPAVTGWRGG